MPFRSSTSGRNWAHSRSRSASESWTCNLNPGLWICPIIDSQSCSTFLSYICIWIISQPLLEEKVIPICFKWPQIKDFLFHQQYSELIKINPAFVRCHHHHQPNVHFLPRLDQGYGRLLPNQHPGRQPTFSNTRYFWGWIIVTFPFRENPIQGSPLGKVVCLSTREQLEQVFGGGANTGHVQIQVNCHLIGPSV